MLVSRNAQAEDLVISFIASACNLERDCVTNDTSVLDLGLDSLTLTALVAHLEAHYDAQFSADDVLRLLDAERVRDIVEMVGDHRVTRT